MSGRLWILVAAFIASVPGGPVGRAPLIGTIHGRVRFNEVPPVPDHRPAVSDLAGSSATPIDRRRSVVYLESAPTFAFDELRTSRGRMDQRNEQFVPHLLAITAGTIVDFPNSDTKFHNVFSLSRVKTFDLGRYPIGQSKSVLFDKPGIVPVSCDIHSHMSAYILVFSHPFFAITEEDGRYTIPRVPSGSYTLMVWSELGRAEPRRIQVADGAISEGDFQIRLAP